jgi:hypothetical protein
MLSSVMNVFLQVFERNFSFFHAASLRSTLGCSRSDYVFGSHQPTITTIAAVTNTMT